MLRFPKIDDQLASTNQDLRLVWAAKQSILDFWWEVTTSMQPFLSVQRGIRFEHADRAAIERIIQRTEWATIAHHGRNETLEVILQLGWGKPEDARYRRDFPKSGSEFVHAVYPGREPLG
jgi:hypothetical protein